MSDLRRHRLTPVERACLPGPDPGPWLATVLLLVAAVTWAAAGCPGAPGVW